MRSILLAACALGACAAPPASDSQAATNQRVAVDNLVSEAATNSALPVAETPPETRARLSYKCIDGSRMAARFEPAKQRVTLVRGGKTLVLKQERVASGIRYAGGGVSFAGKGESMTFSQPNLPPLPCSPIRR